MAIIENKAAPGTLQLGDETEELHVKHSKGSKRYCSCISTYQVCSPPVNPQQSHDLHSDLSQPDDPEDQLNGSLQRNLLQASCVAMYTDRNDGLPICHRVFSHNPLIPRPLTSQSII